VASVNSMASMFFKAAAFNQCLSLWAGKGKALSGVSVGDIFYGSGCPDKANPDPLVGPWCQGENEGCYATPTSADDCTLCTSSTVITASGSQLAFRTKVDQCISGNCQDDVPIGCWDTSEVTDMRWAFLDKALFNDSIKCWNVASVTNMQYMFFTASNFNQPLDDWNVASVTDMNKMFASATNFNQPLDDWNVASVKQMPYMFYEATAFNQCLSTWADESPPNAFVNGIFKGSGCPKKDALANVSPWCREDEQCSASLTEEAPIAPLTKNPIARPTNAPIAKQKKITKKNKN